jgi:acyl-coenzyme A synthetase/AMP-(fatty) acid ligase
MLAVCVDDAQFGQRLKAFVVVRDGEQLTQDVLKRELIASEGS